MAHEKQPPRRSYVALLVMAVFTAAFLYQYVRLSRTVSHQADKAVAAQQSGFERLRQVDPALVKWQQVAKIDLGTQTAKSLDVDEKGNLYVVDGVSLRSWSLAKPDETPAVVPVQADLVQYGSELFLTTAGAMADGTGSVVTDVERAGTDTWVADSGKREIRRVAADGSVKMVVGRGQLIVPSPHLKVVLKPDGNLLVNNPGKLRVETWSPQGKLLSHFGRAGVDIEGFSGCCNPIDIAVLPDGRIVTAEKGLPRIKLYKPDGTFDCVVATPADLSREAQPELTVTKSGRILVLDAPRRVVRVYAPK